ncbi:MAG: glycosyltransferase family 4 protein [Anaerolineae bacterium]|nr:glycosyltransferase family 4 protein [Anaerolineae bacterium]
MLNWRDIKNPLAGGAEVATHELMRRWAAWGHDCTLFSASFPGAPAEERLDGVRIVRQGGPYTVQLRAWRRYLSDLGSCGDVVIDQCHGLPFWTPFYARVPTVGYIHEVAGEIWHQMAPFPLSLFGPALEVWSLRRYRDVPFITVSPSTRDDLVTQGLRRVQVIPNGLSCPVQTQVPEKEGELTILFAGRLTKMKGVEDALDAFAQVVEAVPGARLWVVGSGQPAYERTLQERARHLRLETKITFWGRVSEAQKLDLMGRAHVLIHPSVKEGWGLVVLEANAQGTPAIGYAVAGLRDSIRHGETGLLAPPQQPGALAEAIVSLWRNRSRREAFSRAALAWAATFRWDDSARAWCTVLEQAARLG